MKLIKIIATTSALCAFATTAAAQDGNAYGNVGVELLDIQGTSWNVVGRVGYDLHEYFAVEGEGSVGVIEDSDDFKLDYKIAGFVRGKYPLGEQFEVFARVGYYYADSDIGDGDDIAFGGGIEYFFNSEKRHSVRLDYTNLEGDGGSADVFSVVYGIRF